MARIFVPGVSVHVIRRGINRCPIFHDDDDRVFFLRVLREIVDETGAVFNALVMMDTHYHGLATPPTKSALSTTMKAIGERYVTYFNQKYARIGTLWTGRYRAIPIQTERYWFTCLRYIEQNPVRAAMVRSPADYRWSSYRIHAYGQRTPMFEWLTEHPLYRSLGSTPQERQAAYRAMSAVPLTDDELELQRYPPRRRRHGADQLAGTPAMDLSM